MTVRAVRYCLVVPIWIACVSSRPAVGQETTHQTLTRAIEAIILGGGGYYSNGSTAFQPTVSAEFVAQTSLLDLGVGYHYGFSDPSSQSLHVGVRLPIRTDSAARYFADAALLLFDDGFANGLQIGMRADVGGRTGPIEYRLATELRRFPFLSSPEVWGGIELGVAMTIFKHKVRGQTRKDSLYVELRPIATSEELDRLDSLMTDKQLDDWIEEFWQNHAFAGTTGAGAREEYMHRVKTVNERFGSEYHLGVQTDKGRIFLRFGEPNAMETSFSTLRSDRKYELWTYYDRLVGHKTALFLFLQPESPTGTARSTRFAGPGGFEEVFSNVQGEALPVIPSDLPTPMYNFIESHSR